MVCLPSGGLAIYWGCSRTFSPGTPLIRNEEQSYKKWWKKIFFYFLKTCSVFKTPGKTISHDKPQSEISAKKKIEKYSAYIYSNIPCTEKQHETQVNF